MTKAENPFDARLLSSIDSSDDDPDLMWIKYRLDGRYSDRLQHLQLRVNLTMSRDMDIDSAESGRQSFEITFWVLAIPGSALSQHTLLPLTFEDNLDKSASIALPINVNPGSSDSFNLMRHWIRCCETSHNCGFTEAPDDMPSMLLDVQSLASEDSVKIIKVSETMKEWYISLSYCWAAAAQKVMNLKDIRERLLTGIRTETFDCSIRDAVAVTRELGFKYIWIDALCIPQDDKEAKAKEISRMAQIYGCSTLTIYASRASSVQESFLGEPKAAGWGMDEKYGEQVVFQFEAKFEHEEVHDTNIILVPELSLDDETQVEPLQKRAWTLQELILPTRRLSFGTHKTTWTCLHQSADILRDGWTDGAGTLEYLQNTVYMDAARIVQRMSHMGSDEIRKN